MVNEKIYLDDEEEVYWTNRPFGYTIVTGDTRTGKTLMVFKIICQTAYNSETKQERRVVIYDPKGSYISRRGKGGITRINRETLIHSGRVYAHTTEIIKQWQPYIKDMTDTMWSGFTFTDNALAKLREILNDFYKEIDNNPNNLYNLIRTFPTTAKEAKQRGYPYHCNYSVKENLFTTFSKIRKMFAKGKRIDIAKLVLERNVLFTPPKAWQENNKLLRAYYYLMSVMIQDSLKETRAMVVFEEASRLLPNDAKLSGAERMTAPPLISWFDDLLNVWMGEYSLNIILVAQHMSQLHYIIGSDEPVSYYISGYVSNDKELSTLRYNYFTGEREFQLIDVMFRAVARFESGMVGCQYK